MAMDRKEHLPSVIEVDDNDPRCRTIDRIITAICVLILLAIVVLIVGLFTVERLTR
jgi:hypothetical protein